MLSVESYQIRTFNIEIHSNFYPKQTNCSLRRMNFDPKTCLNQLQIKFVQNLPIICLFAHFKAVCLNLEGNNKAIFIWRQIMAYVKFVSNSVRHWNYSPIIASNSFQKLFKIFFTSVFVIVFVLFFFFLCTYSKDVCLFLLQAKQVGRQQISFIKKKAHTLYIVSKICLPVCL